MEWKVFANRTLFTAGENVEATVESASSKNEEATDVKEQQTANDQSNEGDTTGEESEAPPAEAANSCEDHAETDNSAAQLTSEQQRTYANLQPIFLAMEMGQEAVNQAQEQNQENTAVEIGQQQAAYIATTSEQFTQPTQGASVLLSNVTTSGSEPPASLASILQDVVSGMQSGTGTVPAAIITDPNSGSGSFLIVNQNGVPIVRPVLVSNLPAGGVGQGGAVSVSAETLQVLTAGLHAVDDGSAGSGQETVTVDVSAEAEGMFCQFFLFDDLGCVHCSFFFFFHFQVYNYVIILNLPYSCCYLVGSSGGGDLSVEATVDIGTDTVAVVAGTQAAVAQPVGDNAAELEEGEVEASVAIQSKSDCGSHFSVLLASNFLVFEVQFIWKSANLQINVKRQ